MTNEKRDQIRKDRFDRITKKSWTYARLTEAEKKRCEEALFFFPIHGDTVRQIVQSYESIYHAFLMALDYDALNWREERNDPATLF